ncbi:MAG TPA: biotin transporter BioY [Deltaproteobacteria bacterium]|nr:biotin transporter BioY [Deltaproteobacteria bacterium]
MNIRMLCLIPVCSALTAAGALIRIPIAPVPITLQNFFVILTGIILGPKAGAMSQIIYIIIGLAGLPVFSGGGGPSYIFKPTFGYILGFIAASATAGYVMKQKKFNAATVFSASALGMLAIYLIGVPYLALYLYFIMHNTDAVGIALKTGMMLFIPGDLLKCMVIAMIMPRLASLTRLKKR